MSNTANPLYKRITKLFNIQYPIIQAGMVWTSGWKLASAVSNAGGLGIIGSGSMSPEVLQEHIDKLKTHCTKPYAVNIPLFYKHSAEHIQSVIKNKVPIVFTSAGNPKMYTEKLKQEGIKVIHVVSSLKFALKCQETECDAIVAEGFEAGGHNGIEETTTFCLIPHLKEKIHIPIIAAGGIYNGKTMLASMILGAEGVQIGTRFALTMESSMHPSVKEKILSSQEGATKLMMKKIMPVRLLKNPFYYKIEKAECQGVNKEELSKILGKGRAKKGMFEGDLIEGKIEIGQCSSMINIMLSAKEVVKNIWSEFTENLKTIRI